MGEERDRPGEETPENSGGDAEEIPGDEDAEIPADDRADAPPRPTPDRSRYLSTKEAAELLGVNRATVINWARQGKFGGFQYGVRGIYRFERQELLEFIGRSRIPYPQSVEDLSGDDAGL